MRDTLKPLGSQDLEDGVALPSAKPKGAGGTCKAMGVCAGPERPALDDCPMMMAERRRYQRFTAPTLTVVIDGEAYVASSWSLGGVVVEGYRGRLAMGSLLTIESLSNPRGDLSPVKVRARVVRRESGRWQMALNFLDLDERAYGLLQECMAERMRVLRDQQDGPLPDDVC